MASRVGKPLLVLPLRGREAVGGLEAWPDVTAAGVDPLLGDRSGVAPAGGGGLRERVGADADAEGRRPHHGLRGALDEGVVDGRVLVVEPGVDDEGVGGFLGGDVEDGSVLGVPDGAADDGDAEDVSRPVGSEVSALGSLLENVEVTTAGGGEVDAEVDILVGGVGVSVGEAEYAVGGRLGGGELDEAVAGGDLLRGDGAGCRQ
jgi:hypothetical protein